MFHFISGYTAKVAGTEEGVTEPQTTFSACFGAPFMPLHPTKYAEMLGEKMKKHDVNVWLINTGWSGGVYGVGERISIKNTRHLLNEALSGNLSNIEMRKDENFGFMIPISIAGIDSSILNPRNTWTDPNAYDAQANKLINMFIENFKKFEADVDEKIKSSGPIIN